MSRNWSIVFKCELEPVEASFSKVSWKPWSIDASWNTRTWNKEYIHWTWPTPNTFDFWSWTWWYGYLWSHSGVEWRWISLDIWMEIVPWCHSLRKTRRSPSFPFRNSSHTGFHSHCHLWKELGEHWFNLNGSAICGQVKRNPLEVPVQLCCRATFPHINNCPNTFPTQDRDVQELFIQYIEVPASVQQSHSQPYYQCQHLHASEQQHMCSKKGVNNIKSWRKVNSNTGQGFPSPGRGVKVGEQLVEEIFNKGRKPGLKTKILSLIPWCINKDIIIDSLFQEKTKNSNLSSAIDSRNFFINCNWKREPRYSQLCAWLLRVLNIQ